MSAPGTSVTSVTSVTSHALIEHHFAAALDTPAAERDARLDADCADAAVRAEVRRLLARHDELSASDGDADGFLGALDLGRAARLVASVADADEPRSIARYEVVRLLGRGATGAVYLARDPVLGRHVAVKLLAAHLSADAVGMRRFEQEARAASALDHPRVATIYEIGSTDDGRRFIAMAYHAGTTLRDRIAEGPLPVDEAVRIAAEIGDGLAAAHAQGIVHRDIKPENVLLTARGACIVDFGIAKVAGQLATRTGATLGTAAYMSPEQTRGPDVDHRTDLWSLGVVLHEMLAGRRPFGAEGAPAIVYGVRHDAPAPIERLRPDVPAHVADVVRRCLAKDPADRFASADALVAALRAPGRTDGVRRLHWPGRGWGLALLLAAAGALALGIRARGPRAAPVAASTATIAVLPFVAVGPIAAHAYLADGMRDDVMRRLGSVPHMRVADPSSVRQAMRTDTAMPAIGERLGVTATLRGTIRDADDGVHVTTQLVRTGDGRALWSGSYAWRAGDGGAIADDIRRRVLATLHVAVADSSGWAVGRVAGDPLAYDLYLRGRFALDQHTPTGLATAAVYFREAMARDSTFARAYVGLAEVYLAEQEAEPGERFRRARPLVARALAQDSMLAAAQRAAGWIAMWYDHDWATAERHLRRAVALDPSDIWGYHALAAYLGAVGRYDEALAVSRQTTALDPVSAISATHLGAMLFARRRYAESIAVLEHALARDTMWKRTHVALGRSYLAVGRHDEAIRLLRRTGYEYAAFEPAAILANALGVAGHRAEARRMVDDLEARARGSYVRPVDLVAAHLGLGDTARALDWAERIPDDRGSMSFLLGDPMFDAIRETPRFARVLERMGLGDAARRQRARAGADGRR